MKDRKKRKNATLEEVAYIRDHYHNNAVPMLRRKVCVVPPNLTLSEIVLHSWINSKHHYGFRKYIQTFDDHMQVVSDYVHQVRKNGGKFIVFEELHAYLLHLNHGFIHRITNMPKRLLDKKC